MVVLSPNKDIVNDAMLADQFLAVDQPRVEICDATGLTGAIREAGTDWVVDVPTCRYQADQTGAP